MTNWQQEYENGSTPWDKGAPAPALVDYLQEHGPLRGRVLVPGCGTGSDIIPLAAAGADQVTGLDIAPLAVEAARKRLAALPDAVVAVELADLFTDCARPPLAGTFDAVWEHTCYCAIPPERRPDYVRAMASALKPGGLLLGVFYLNPWDPEEDQDQGPPFGCTEESLEASFSPAFDLLESRRPARAYPGREGREVVRLMRRRG
ncbi:MAG: SAM-dependent methyltransferase [Verrucomicrobiales bacterium]|nr:SAM-dependent methyltransferase [Verrucomicrobiales bacterium]